MSARHHIPPWLPRVCLTAAVACLFARFQIQVALTLAFSCKAGHKGTMRVSPGPWLALNAKRCNLQDGDKRSRSRGRSQSASPSKAAADSTNEGAEKIEDGATLHVANLTR